MKVNNKINFNIIIIMLLFSLALYTACEMPPYNPGLGANNEKKDDQENPQEDPKIGSISWKLTDMSEWPYVYQRGLEITVKITIYVVIENHEYKHKIRELRLGDTEYSAIIVEKDSLNNYWNEKNKAYEVACIFQTDYQNHAPLGTYRAMILGKDKVLDEKEFPVFAQGDATKNKGNIYSHAVKDTPKIMAPPADLKKEVTQDKFRFTFEINDESVNKVFINFYDKDFKGLGELAFEQETIKINERNVYEVDKAQYADAVKAVITLAAIMQVNDMTVAYMADSELINLYE